MVIIMICPICNTNNSDTAKFCKICGHPFPQSERAEQEEYIVPDFNPEEELFNRLHNQTADAASTQEDNQPDDSESSTANALFSNLVTDETLALVKCPHCGKDTYFDTEQSKTVCSHCGAVMLYNEVELPQAEIPYDASADCVIKDGVLIKYNGNAKDIILPDGIITIGNKAFEKNTSIESVDIPASVKSIGDEAFSGCTNLVSVLMCEGLISIGAKAFYQSGIKWLYVPETVQTIGKAAFKQCPNLIEADLSGCQLKIIEDSLFSKCGKLKEAKLPNQIQSIGNFAFRECESLQRMLLPNSVTKIGQAAFRSCKSLLSFSSSPNIAEIGESAFMESAITSFNIVGTITTIEKDTFNSCPNLVCVSICKSVNHITDGAFAHNRNLMIIDLPQEIEEIEPLSFSGCDSLYFLTKYYEFYYGTLSFTTKYKMEQKTASAKESLSKLWSNISSGASGAFSKAKESATSALQAAKEKNSEMKNKK